MSNMNKVIATSETAGYEFTKLMEKLRMILIDGIEHGFFNAEISVTTTQQGRRQILISAGKSFKYTIKTDDLPR